MWKLTILIVWYAVASMRLCVVLWNGSKVKWRLSLVESGVALMLSSSGKICSGC
jgi:hypothetical protein